MFANANNLRKNVCFSDVCLHSRKMLKKIFYIECLKQHKTNPPLPATQTHPATHPCQPPKLTLQPTLATHCNPPRYPPQSTKKTHHQPRNPQPPQPITNQPTTTATHNPQPTPATHRNPPRYPSQSTKKTHHQPRNPQPPQPTTPQPTPATHRNPPRYPPQSTKKTHHQPRNPQPPQQITATHNPRPTTNNQSPIGNKTSNKNPLLARESKIDEGVRLCEIDEGGWGWAVRDRRARVREWYCAIRGSLCEREGATSVCVESRER
jgi:hypothetical protein